MGLLLGHQVSVPLASIEPYDFSLSGLQQQRMIQKVITMQL
jgi:hypothetical protein